MQLKCKTISLQIAEYLKAISFSSFLFVEVITTDICSRIQNRNCFDQVLFTGSDFETNSWSKLKVECWRDKSWRRNRVDRGCKLWKGLELHLSREQGWGMFEIKRSWTPIFLFLRANPVRVEKRGAGWKQLQLCHEFQPPIPPSLPRAKPPNQTPDKAHQTHQTSEKASSTKPSHPSHIS